MEPNEEKQAELDRCAQLHRAEQAAQSVDDEYLATYGRTFSVEENSTNEPVSASTQLGLTTMMLNAEIELPWLQSVDMSSADMQRIVSEERGKRDHKIVEALIGRLSIEELEVVDLTGRTISDEQLQRLVFALEDSPMTQVLLLRNVTFEGPDHGAILAGLISTNHQSLKVLNLHGSNVQGEETAQALTFAHWHNPNISVECGNTRLAGPAIVALRKVNQVVVLSPEEERSSKEKEDAYAAKQEEIERNWFPEVEQDGCAPVEIEYGEIDDTTAVTESAAHEDGIVKSRRNTKAQLIAASREMYGSTNAPEWCGSVMLMAHFGYLNSEQEFRSHDKYGLISVREKPMDPMPMTENLHDTLHSERVKIVSSRASHYTLTLKLHNTSSNRVSLCICAGTIFEHIGWVHRQNLMVRYYKSVVLPANAPVTVSLTVYCMNSMCGYATGQKMYLTDFYMPDSTVLASQERVWQHFDNAFFGSAEATKAKKGKKKKKKR